MRRWWQIRTATNRRPWGVRPGGGTDRGEYELFDRARQGRRLGFAMTARSIALLDVAHQRADAIYEKILGVRCAFWTRIAYVTVTGTGKGASYALMVADSDGYNPQTVVRSPEPLLSPSWSPDGRKLAYVSFEKGNSSIYIDRKSVVEGRSVSGSVDLG